MSEQLAPGTKVTVPGSPNRRVNMEVVAGPDAYGYYCLLEREGGFCFHRQDTIKPAGPRYVVEVRVPLPGDSWLSSTGLVDTVYNKGFFAQPERVVIVETL